ncbi:KipI family sensor histidine kinase inhibitor [Catenulispora sp. MAP12-49]|uniref:5-oxoprolinase subunit B/C family protein n=1 Tax=Catenulispora sp. MAP12-49 TaxID=3156302 RepID=UPI0035162F34
MSEGPGAGAGAASVRPAGPFAVLLEFDSLEKVQRCFAWAERWRAARPGVLVDVVPAERTLMAIATFDDAGQRGLREFVAAVGNVDWSVAGDGDGDSAGGGVAQSAQSEIVELPVLYEGPDLDDVARLTGLATNEIVSLHTAAEFTVAFTGFAPGFAYLTGLPDVLRVPRRDAPRTRVPAGAVALGGPYSGVYPRESPGGWQLIGRLAAWAPALWDETRDSPALLRPGTRVRFRDAAERSGPDGAPGVSGDRDEATAEAGGPGLRVVRAGPLTTVQDLGRPGFAHLGVPRSGAVDRASLKLANRLVGNEEGAAALELTLGGGAVCLEVGRWVAVAGARCEVTVSASVHGAGDDDGAAEGAGDGAGSRQQTVMRTVPGAAFYVPGGAVVDVGPAAAGVRAYLAVAGGVGGAGVLGSRSVDLLSGVGGRALVTRERVALGDPTGLPPDIPGLGLAPLRDADDPVVVRLVLGPRSEWFTDDAVRDLIAAQWTVGMESNRTAVRLDGPMVQRARDGEPASEPLVVGAVQIPHDGRPVLFLADHPVTGGYPVIACAHPADLDAVGQARPGTGIRFRMVGTSSRR